MANQSARGLRYLLWRQFQQSSAYARLMRRHETEREEEFRKWQQRQPLPRAECPTANAATNTPARDYSMNGPLRNRG